MFLHKLEKLVKNNANIINNTYIMIGVTLSSILFLKLLFGINVILYQIIFLVVIAIIGIVFVISISDRIEVQPFQILVFLICTSLFGQFLSLKWFRSDLQAVHLYRVLVMLIILSYIIYLIYLKKDYIYVKIKTSSIKYYLYFLLLWAFWVTLSVIWAPDIFFSIQIAFVYVSGIFLTFTIPLFIDKKEKLSKLFKILVIMMILTLIIGALEGVGIKAPIAKTVNDDVDFFGNRMGSFFGNPNDFAVFLTAICMPYILNGFKFLKSNMQKASLLIIFLVSFVIIVYSTSRSCLFALVTCFVVSFLHGYRMRIIKFRDVAIIFSFLGLAITALIIYSSQYISYVQLTKLTLVLNDPVYLFLDHHRLQLLSAVWDFMKSHPINFFIGVGPKGFDHYFSINIVCIGGNGFPLTSLHNWWLQVFADSGIFIFILYNLFYISITYNLYRISLATKDRFFKFFSLSLFISFIAFIPNSITSSGLIYFVPLWIQWGIALAVISLYRVERRERLQDSKSS